MSDRVCVIHDIPWSTAMQLYDADKSCHLRNIIQGRMRTHTCSWSHRQTNKCSWGYVERVKGADKRNGERSFTLWGACSLLWKVLCISFQISTMSAERSPSSPLRPAGKRLNEPKLHSRGINSREPAGLRGLWVTEMWQWQFISAIHQHLQLFVQLCLHSASLVSCMHAVHCVCVCVFVWMTELITETHPPNPADAFPLKSECLIQRKNWRSWSTALSWQRTDSPEPHSAKKRAPDGEAVSCFNGPPWR